MFGDIAAGLVKHGLLALCALVGLEVDALVVILALDLGLIDCIAHAFFDFVALLNSEASCCHLVLNSLSQSTEELGYISALPDLLALDQSLAVVLGHITAVLLVLSVANLVFVVDALLSVFIVVVGFTLLFVLGTISRLLVVIIVIVGPITLGIAIFPFTIILLGNGLLTGIFFLAWLFSHLTLVQFLGIIFKT